ncbi:MAG: FtsX-like permease family protein [Anaerolineae bacterium]|nr:FtsX-like permease family protein [Anaerolineae bacterium]
MIPVILSTAYADMFGSRSQRNSYTIGEIGVVTFALPEGNRDLRFRVMGFLPTYPAAGDRFLIAPSDDLLMFLNATASPESYYTNNTAWLTLPDRQMDATARSQIEALPGLIGISEAWVVYNQLLREPLPNAIIGVLFAGFWISLLLGLLDFAFYLVMTASRRATTFAVLRAMGLNGARLWGLLTAEQLTLIVPAIGVGVLLGALLAALLIPFLSLYGDEGLLIPVGQIGGLLLVFIVSFTALLTGATIALTRSKIGQVLRLGDE